MPALPWKPLLYEKFGHQADRKARRRVELAFSLRCSLAEGPDPRVCRNLVILYGKFGPRLEVYGCKGPTEVQDAKHGSPQHHG